MSPRLPAVINLHRSSLAAPLERVTPLIDDLGTSADALWPAERWPALELNGPMQRGTKARHGPIRYFVQEYTPGRVIRFRFTAPEGFDGTHEFVLERNGAESTLVHLLRMDTHGSARLAWLWFYRPLHDALIEDALLKARAFAAGSEVVFPPRSRRVRFLLWLASRREK